MKVVSPLRAFRTGFRAAVVVGAFLLCAVAFAAPTDRPLNVCRVAGHYANGADLYAEPECADWVSSVTVADLQPDWQITYQTSADGYTDHFWSAVADLSPSARVWVMRGEDFEFFEWSESGYVPPEDPGEGGGLPEEMDVEAFAAAFAGAFMCCAMFWGLGKGISQITNLVRRG